MKAALDLPSQMGAYLLVSAILRGLARMPRHALRPNPSRKRSANDKPPAPGRWCAVHFNRPGASGLPWSPAKLSR